MTDGPCCLLLLVIADCDDPFDEVGVLERTIGAAGSVLVQPRALGEPCLGREHPRRLGDWVLKGGQCRSRRRDVPFGSITVEEVTSVLGDHHVRKFVADGPRDDALEEDGRCGGLVRNHYEAMDLDLALPGGEARGQR